MSQNEKKVFGRHKKQEESPLEQTQAVPAVQDEIAAEPAAEASPKRNKYADKMNRKKRRLSKGARIGITAAAIALLLGGGIWAVVKSRDAGTENVTQTTAAVSCGDLETYIEGSGVTAAKKREELGREVKGKVTQVLVAEGDEVHTGDPLLVIDPTETRKELADAQKELTEAERGVSDAQLEVSKAQSDLSAAQRKLSRLHITAPFTGKLIPTKDSDNKDVSFRVGEQVSEGQVIGYMVNDRQMKLTLAFSAEYARSIRTGQAATVSIASAMSEVSGTVSSVETAQQISSEGVRVIRVGITVNNPGSLTKGMTATATINAGRLGAIYPANAGTLEYSREEAVTAQISGEIIKLNGTSYSTYNGGALIMSLSSDASKDEISAAQNGIAAANRTVASAKTVADEKRAHIAELQQKIQNSTVTSPIDGVVVSLNAVEGQEAMIERADVEIISEDIPGWLVANEGRLTVALDITVTENLRKEGLARELVNRIQNLRKSSGYDITDKISVTVLSNDGMDEAIKDFNSYIANQVLAVSVEITDVISDATEMDFEDFKLSVRIEKA